MFHLITPQTDNYAQFLRIFPKKFQPLLERYQPQSEIIIVGAMIANRLVGIIAGAPNETRDRVYTVWYFLVLPAYRNSGIEHALLRHAEHQIRAWDYTQIETKLRFASHAQQIYTLSDAPGVFAIFRELGWDEACLIHTSFYLHDDQRIMEERWFRLHPPEGYELFFWKDLRPQDREALQADHAQLEQQAQDYSDPLAAETFDEHTSFGVRHTATGKIVGWMLNQAQSAELLSFSRLFILPEARNRRLFHPLLANAIAHGFGIYRRATFNVAANNGKMKATVLRMMAPFCDDLVDCYYVKKELSTTA